MSPAISSLGEACRFEFEAEVRPELSVMSFSLVLAVPMLSVCRRFRQSGHVLARCMPHGWGATISKDTGVVSMIL